MGMTYPYDEYVLAGKCSVCGRVRVTDKFCPHCMELKIEELEKRIEALEQEPTGHWIRVTDKTGHLVWECDKCSWQQRFNTNFCPNCGARMRGEESGK